MMTLPPVCFKCKHFNQEKVSCPAFPDQDIPDEILNGDNDHKTPLKGQRNDIVFEPKAKSDQ